MLLYQLMIFILYSTIKFIKNRSVIDDDMHEVVGLDSFQQRLGVAMLLSRFAHGAYKANQTTLGISGIQSSHSSWISSDLF